MNRLIILVFSILLTVTSAKICADTGFGFKMGLTSANQSWEYKNVPGMSSQKYDYRYGINAGVFAEFLEFQFISLLSDLYFSQKGMLAEVIYTSVEDMDGTSGRTIEYDNRLDYIGLSLISKAKYKFDAFNPYILTGLKYEILVNKDTYKGFDLVYNKYDGNIFGIIIGAGVEFTEILPYDILIEGIYNYDLNSVEISNKLEIRNLAYELRIGLKF